MWTTIDQMSTLYNRLYNRFKPLTFFFEEYSDKITECYYYGLDKWYRSMILFCVHPKRNINSKVDLVHCQGYTQ